MPRSNTVYLKSQSGKIETFDQFRKKLRELGTSESMRFKEVRSLLMKEAQPLVTEARRQAYEGAVKGPRIKLRGGKAADKTAKGAFYNLYNTINKFKNKGREKAYVVVSLRSEKKSPAGAYYAKWFLGGSKKFKAKDYIGKAVRNTNVLKKANTMMRKHIQKRITSILR
jgi:hypothetical protein